LGEVLFDKVYVSKHLYAVFADVPRRFKLYSTATVISATTVISALTAEKKIVIKKYRYEINPLVNKLKVKLLLDLCNARPAPTDPGCRPG
jgi:hypothetical protein